MAKLKLEGSPSLAIPRNSEIDMAASNFTKCLAFVLESEGGYSNSKFDPGHETQEGVTQAVYTAWRAGEHLAPKPVRGIEMTEVEAIYENQYWSAVHADDLPRGLDYCVFDAAVNSGPIQAVEWLQRALSLNVDGHYGIITAHAVKAIADASAHKVAGEKDALELIDAYDMVRLGFMHRLRTWTVFGKGWYARVNLVTSRAKIMVGVAA
jgi:lysozyme family protein